MRKAGKILMLAAAAVLYTLAVRFGSAAFDAADVGTVRLTGQKLDAKGAADILEQEAGQEEPQGFCIWGETSPEAVVCRETGRSANVSGVLTAGNSEMIVPGIGALAWQENGCFLDWETAEELFGTRQAAGQTVWCQERPYIVCGTFQSLKKMLVRQAADEDGAVLDTLSVYLGGKSGGTEELLLRSGLSGETMDFLFWNALVQDMLLVLPLLFAGRLIFVSLRQVRKADGRGEKAIFLALVLTAAAAAAWLLLRCFWLPADMIPTKWSDFSFWSSWWEGQEKNLLLLFGSALGEAQLVMFRNLALSVLCNLCAVWIGGILLTQEG